MENFRKLTTELSDKLLSIKYEGDISDIGNEIGIIIEKYFDKDNNLNDFIHGLKHGISLSNGTHN